jgi:hypothetical protein
VLRLQITAKGKAQLEKALIEACWEIADRIYSEAQSNIAEREWIGHGTDGSYSSIITDTGELLGSGSVERRKDGAMVAFSAPYASYIEYGLPPGTPGPPAEILARWVSRKLGIARKDAMKIAWAVKVKIQQEGTTARPFLRDSVYTVVATYKRRAVLK